MSGATGLVPLLGLLAILVALPARAEKKALAPGERVDLNTATAAELMRLPGVGKKRAEAIVASRDKRPFRRPEEVTRVKGCSPGWYAKVKGMVTASEAPGAQRPPAPTRTPATSPPAAGAR